MFRKTTSGFVSICILVLLGLLPSQLAAQSIAGSISGSLVDPSGAVIPAVDVSLINERTSETRATTSSDVGEFVFAAVQPGRYTVKAEKTGFRGFIRKGIELTVSERVGLGRIQLELGEVSDVVNVTLEGEQVTTESGDVAAVLSLNQLDNLTTKGRDVMNLLRTLPGVTTVAVQPWGTGELGERDPSGTQSNGGQFGSFTPAIGGARTFWNTVTVDGQVGSNQDFPGLFESAISMDAVAEAKIISNNYTADYGRNPGSTINLVSKSGAQDFHGNVYFYKRHENLNANDWFNNRDGIPKPVYRFSTFGFNVSGPVYVPHLFNTEKKKLFFFYSQENWWVKLPQSINHRTVPTAAERLGDFSQTLKQDGTLRVIKDPLTGLPFPGNIIPSNRINHDAQLMLNIMPLPNNLNRDVTGGNYNFEWQDICDIPKMLNALKVDYHPTEKDHFSFLPRRWRADTRAYGCASLGYGGNLPIWKHHYYYLTDSVVMTWTRTLSPTKVNEFSSGFTGEKEQGPPKDLFGRTVENYFDPIRRDKLGYQTGQLFPQINNFNIIPGVLFGGVPNPPNLTPAGRLPDDQGYNRYHLTDNFSWIHGAHTMKFGLYLEVNWATDGPSASCFSGCFYYDRDVHNPGDTNWAFSNALLGNFRRYRETNSRPRYQGKDTIWEWFAQDTWKVNRKLTLTYGMRFSWFTPWYLNKGPGAAFVLDRYDLSQVPPLYQPVLDSNGNRLAKDPITGQLFPEVYIGAFAASSFSFPGQVLASDTSYPRGFREQHGVQPAPRFGFAYDVFGDGKMAIRGGFGIMKQTTPTYSAYITNTVDSPPGKYTPQIFYGNMNTFLTAGQQLLYPTGTYSYQRNDNVPSIYRYSLGIQRELGFGTVITADYVGNVGRHLLQAYDPNIVPYGAHFQPQNIDPTTGSALPDDFYRPIPGYNGIYTYITSGYSNYNALQVAINRRFSRGVSFGVSYTWSKTMGLNDNWGAPSDGGQLATYRPWRVWNYGVSSFDQTQMLVINYVWDLPKLSKYANNALVRGVFDNWQVAGVTTFSSGLPFPINVDTTDGADIAGGGDGWRAMLVGQPQLSRGDRTFDRFFNTAAFGRPPQGYYGNAPILPIRGPGLNNWDLTLMKQFPLWSEVRRLQFRAEMYNAWNHPNFSYVDNNALFDETGQQVNGTFGQINGARSARVIQLSLRFTF